ncbi:MAG: hypothetical protein HQK53_17400, partial [Oligoflexia bacterium]|nr:hypothetical protein [Oligoflexia bacterium]
MPQQALHIAQQQTLHPERVVEAAFALIKCAKDLIDMRTHRGEHPRMGAVDVCPLVPVSGVSMDEC